VATELLANLGWAKERLLWFAAAQLFLSKR
jgi:hypothetical protein